MSQANYNLTHQWEYWLLSTSPETKGVSLKHRTCNIKKRKNKNLSDGLKKMANNKCIQEYHTQRKSFSKDNKHSIQIGMSYSQNDIVQQKSKPNNGNWNLYS